MKPEIHGKVLISGDACVRGRRIPGTSYTLTTCKPFAHA